MKAKRDEEICRMYVSGKTLEQCGKHFKLSSERIRQVLRKGGVYKNFRAKQQSVGLVKGKVISGVRDEFLGVNLSESDKDALRREAERRGLSMSALTSNLIKEMLETLRLNGAT